MTKLRLRLAGLVVALIAAAGQAGAVATVGEIILVRERVPEDLLAAGRTVSIGAPIAGDLTVAGADVAVERPVEGYLWRPQETSK